MFARRPLAALFRRGESALGDVAGRSRESLGVGFRRLGHTLVPLVQSAAAAAIAWLVATRLIGHSQPFFASIAAVLSLGVSLGQRLRRSVELVFGVAIGILVADLLVAVIGRGWWQIGLVVLLAMAAAVLAGGGAVLVNQGAGSAILIVALAPTAGSMASAPGSRFVDALVGGAVGLLVNAVLLPMNPVVLARRSANPLLDELAAALEARDVNRVDEALQQARAIESALTEFREALGAGREIARIAPFRRRSRGHLMQYVDAVDHIDHAVRNVRVLARRAVVAVQRDEAFGPGLPAAIRRLGEAVRTLRNELGKGAEPRAARQGLVDAVELATAAVGPGFSANVMIAQIRSAAHDLLRAAGLELADVDRALRRVEPPAR
jgi:uncharacterized membrane protein YgaE (UPF0421/DUF939 family)